jgi:hypothetical protein
MLFKKVLSGIILILLVGVLAATAGCAVIIGSGNLETREFGNTDFTRVEIGYAFEAEIYQDNAFLVKITLDDNLYEYLDLSQNGDTLKITMKPGYVFSKATQRAVVTLPYLERLEISGASRANVSDFVSLDSLDFEISGASQIAVTGVSSPDIHVLVSGASKADVDMTMTSGHFELSGASTLDIVGSARDISVDASGASRADLSDFPVINAWINLSGASNGTINAAGELNADLSGASTLHYIGNPALGDISTSGASTISPK